MTLWLVHQGSPDWLARHHPNGPRRDAGRAHALDLDQRPAPTVCATGICGGLIERVWLEDDGQEPTLVPDPRKPPYRVPSPADILALPWNGYTVASTFSGGGGSCTGYRMAGYRVVWASDIVPEARETYLANAPAGALIDGRDIRDVQPADIFTATGLKVGELDIFDGSPPCQSFSTAGKRERGWGKVIGHSDGTTQVSDDLFFEYARLLEGLQPRVFVAENVAGLVRGTAKGYFKLILRKLRSCGYRAQARLLDAQWLGVPQHRERLIFVGVRDDLEVDPAFPAPLPYRYTVRDAISDLLLRDGLHVTAQVVGNDDFEPRWGPPDTPHPTVTASGARTSGLVEVEPEAWLRGKVARIVDQMQPGQSGQDVTGRGYFSLRRLHWDKSAGTVQASEATTASTNQVHPNERRRLTIAELRRICAFPDDYRLAGSYAQQWARLGNAVPPLMMRAVAEVIRDQVLARAGKVA